MLLASTGQRITGDDMNPAIENLKNLPGPDTIDRKTISNGSIILTFSNFNNQSINLVGLLENGGVVDPEDKLGLAHFTASMLSRGTEKRSFAEYHDALESRGANLVFSCGSQQTWFRGKALAEDTSLLFELAAESLRFPAFPPDYIERLRNQLLAGLAIRDQDTSEVASLLFDQTLFPGHPFSHPVDGYIETIQPITRDDLITFHQDYYTPEGLILVAAGAVDSTQIGELAEKHFGDWNNPAAIKIAVQPVPSAPSKNIRKHRYVEEKSQSDLFMGSYGPSRPSEDYLPVFLGNNILGQFGLMGRIGESVRSKSGLAYHASSSINGWADAGTWEFVAGLNPENLDKAIELIRDEIRRFINSPVSAEELNDSKSNLIGRLPLSLESNAGIANAILTIERFNLGMDYYQRYPDLMQSITAQKILDSSRKFLHPDKMVIASAGQGKNTG